MHEEETEQHCDKRTNHRVLYGDVAQPLKGIEAGANQRRQEDTDHQSSEQLVAQAHEEARRAAWMSCGRSKTRILVGRESDGHPAIRRAAD